MPIFNESLPGVKTRISTVPGYHGSLLNPETCHKSEILILAGSGLLASMTVMAKQTATGKYLPYDDDGTDDGRRTAVGFLAFDAHPGDSDDMDGVLIEGNMYIDYAKLPSTSGIDANAVTDLAAKVTWKNGVSS